MYSSGGYQRSWEAHRADYRYLTIIQLEGSRVLRGIFYCFQMCRANCILKMSGSISVGLMFTYSLMIKHGYDIMTVAKPANKMLFDVTNILICFNKVFRFIHIMINQVELLNLFISITWHLWIYKNFDRYRSCHRHTKTIILFEFVPCFLNMITVWEKSWTPAGSAFISKWQHSESMNINHFQQRQLLM